MSLPAIIRPTYNGFKVYWQHGGQVVPPHDDGIIQQFKKITTATDAAPLTFADAVQKKLVTTITTKIDTLHRDTLSHVSPRQRS